MDRRVKPGDDARRTFSWMTLEGTMMAAVLIEAPAVEPVSLAEVKEHLRVDGPDEEPLIVALITTARLTIEHLAGLALVTQRWAVLLDAWPDASAIELPVAPVASVDAVRVYDEADQASVIDPAEYFADLASRPARLVRRGQQAGRRPAASPTASRSSSPPASARRPKLSPRPCAGRCSCSSGTGSRPGQPSRPTPSCAMCRWRSRRCWGPIARCGCDHGSASSTAGSPWRRRLPSATGRAAPR
jgi:hypothetical protein